VVTVFSTDDPPDDVCALLTRVAGGLPHLRTGAFPKAVPKGANEYQTSIPLHSPADDGAARAMFLRWIWYASRRAGLHLNEADDDFSTPERIERSLRVIGPTLRLSPDDQRELVPNIRIARYATEEALQVTGQIPKQMTFIVHGRVRLSVMAQAGAVVQVRVLNEGDYLGQTALTREPVRADATALEEVTVLQIDREHLEDLVLRKPLLLQEIGRAIEERRRDIQRALAAIGG
jgi:CRP-like cAMP-binding protein